MLSNKEISNRIKTFRELANLSVEEVAELCGVTSTTLLDYENEKELQKATNKPNKNILDSYSYFD